MEANRRWDLLKQWLIQELSNFQFTIANNNVDGCWWVSEMTRGLSNVCNDFGRLGVIAQCCFSFPDERLNDSNQQCCGDVCCIENQRLKY